MNAKHKNSKVSFRKAFYCILLLAVVLMFTGLSVNVSAATFENAEKSCCDECNTGTNPNSVDCSTPDCPHFLCLSIKTVSPFILSVSAKNVYIPKFAEELSLKSIPRPIFHPPTIS